MEVNKILVGDVLQTLKTIEDNSVDTILTSPPYYQHRDYKVTGQLGQEATSDDYVNHILEVTKEVHRVLKPTGSFWLNVGDNYVNKSLQMIPEKISIKMMDEQGWLLRNKVIWVKMWTDMDDAYGNCQPTSSRDRFQSSYEPLYFFTKSKDYYSNLNEVGLPLKKSTVVRFFGAFNSKKSNEGNYSVSGRRSHEGFGDRIKKLYNINTLEEAMALTDEDLYNLSKKHCRNIPDVWELGLSTFRGNHIATFPERLCSTVINFSCPPGGLVLDPFSGSGTTCRVAKKLGRNYLGIELNPDYAASSVKLLEELK